MRKLLIVLGVILLLAGVAWGGATTVYPIYQAVMGQSYTLVNGVASAGDTTIVSVGPNQRIKVKRIDFKPDADLTGTVNIQIGVANIYAINNALADNVYGKNLGLDYNQGAFGADLVVNSPADVRYNLDYRLN